MDQGLEIERLVHEVGALWQAAGWEHGGEEADRR
jgi:hypothetical protein